MKKLTGRSKNQEKNFPKYLTITKLVYFMYVLLYFLQCNFSFTSLKNKIIN